MQQTDSDSSVNSDELGVNLETGPRQHILFKNTRHEFRLLLLQIQNPDVTPIIILMKY